jgi:hypothetical protein
MALVDELSPCTRLLSLIKEVLPTENIINFKRDERVMSYQKY